jgi:hypothetical protein
VADFNAPKGFLDCLIIGNAPGCISVLGQNAQTHVTLSGERSDIVLMVCSGRISEELNSGSGYPEMLPEQTIRTMSVAKSATSA